MAGIRKAYDKTFKSLSELECRAIFERLAPEYTVVLNETINVCVAEKKTLVTEADLRITGKELEYKTFFLDEYQVGVVNDMGKGHRVILANPGAGKSVLLLSKAFKQIILNGKNWSLFFEDTFVRPEEANLVGGKDPKTDWILRVNSISNKLSKESYSVPVDEYSYVKSIYDWLMGILVF